MRKLIAIWAGKLFSKAGRLAGKKSSAGPGAIALKICPSFVDDVNSIVKKKVIITCGTNGKTTTNNLICTALEEKGYTVLCNRIGANMISGIATTYVQAASLFGKINADYACFEVDEAYAPIVFKKIKPDVMVLTNLFRDQLDRYGEIDTTSELIQKAIDEVPNVKLVLNADDPLCVRFGKGKDVTYYGISERVMTDTNDTKEGRFCPICGDELDYNYYHYSQLGDFSCSKCGYKRPDPDFDIRNVSLNPVIRFDINGNSLEVNHKGFYNVYNFAAVYTALAVAGESTSDFQDVLSKYRPQIGRMQEFNIGKPVILSLSKNPAGFNQAISTVNTDTRKKDVIIAINDGVGDGQDVSWLWDVDFDKVKNENLNTLTTTGIRLYDLSLRFKYADIDIDLMTESMREAITKALSTDSEVVYVIVNYTALFSTETLLKEMEKGGDK